MKEILYYIIDPTFSALHREAINYIKKDKNLVVFDVGCYRGVFFKKVLKQTKCTEKNSRFYIFDINKNVKKYIHTFLKLKIFFYNEIALSDKSGKAKYNYNRFFESSGSSLSPIVKNDSKWVLSRKIILKLFFQSTKGFIKYEVPTITLDSFVKKKKIKFISILKIDVEGSEEKVLNGAKKNLKKNKIKIILVEILERKKFHKKKEKQIITFLKKYNFELIKKRIALSTSCFSNIKGGDYLFVNKSFKY